MQFATLPYSKINISTLSLGTWAFSGAKIWGTNDDQDSIRTIHCALEHGINLIDTAQRYGDGKSEMVVGEALLGRRDQAVLATKVYSDNLHTADLIESCEASLRRLRTDYIDLYQIHWPNYDVSFSETFEAMQQLIRDGKVRAISVCNFGPKSLEQSKAYPIELNQIPYSLVWRVAEKQIIPACQEQGVSMWAYSPLGQGLLTGKYRSIDDVPLNRRETRLYSAHWAQGRHHGPGYEAETFALLAQLHKLCAEHACEVSELAFAFLKHEPCISSILVGARNPQQLMQNLLAFEKQVPDTAVQQATLLSEALKLATDENPDLWSDDQGGRIR